MKRIGINNNKTTGDLFYHNPLHPHISMHILHTVLKDNLLNDHELEIKRSSQLRTLLKRIVENRT